MVLRSLRVVDDPATRVENPLQPHEHRRGDMLADGSDVSAGSLMTSVTYGRDVRPGGLADLTLDLDGGDDATPAR